MTQASPFYVVRRSDNLWNIAKNVFGLSTNAAIAAKVNTLAESNPHLASRDRIFPGQFLYLGKGIEPKADIYADDLRSMEACFKEGANYENNFLIENFSTVQAFLREAEDVHNPGFLHEIQSTPYSIAQQSNGAFMPVLPQFAKLSKEVVSVISKGLKTGIKAASGEFGRILPVSPHYWDVVHGDIVRGLNNQARYIRESSGALRLIPHQARAISSLGKVTLVMPEADGFQKFSTAARKAKGLVSGMKTAENIAGKTAIGINLGLAGYNIHEAWNTENRNRTVATESTKLAVGIGIAKTGPPVATYACALLVEAPPAAAACFFGVLVIYGAGTSMVINGLTDLAADFIFKSSDPKPISP